MKKRIVTAVVMAAISSGAVGAADAVAEESEGWNLFAKTGLALSQTSLSDNWSGSETGSIAWTWTFLGEAEKQVHPKALWSNSLNMAFGQTHQYDKPAERWQRPIKSTDKIRFDTMVRITLGGWVDPYVAGYLKSQFYDEMEGSDSKPRLNPAVISESAGLAHAFLEEEGKKLVTRVGFAFHQNRNAFAPDEEWTHDGGLEWVTDWRFAGEEEKTVYLSKLSVYKAVLFSESDLVEGTPEEDDWKAPDVDWENTFTNKLTDWLSFDVYFQWVYEKQQSKTGQYKQTLGVGLVYQFL